jgi:hypothetical protein
MITEKKEYAEDRKRYADKADRGQYFKDVDYFKSGENIYSTHFQDSNYRKLKNREIVTILDEDGKEIKVRYLKIFDLFFTAD